MCPNVCTSTASHRNGPKDILYPIYPPHGGQREIQPSGLQSNLMNAALPVNTLKIERRLSLLFIPWLYFWLVPTLLIHNILNLDCSFTLSLFNHQLNTWSLIIPFAVTILHMAHSLYANHESVVNTLCTNPLSDVSGRQKKNVSAIPVIFFAR